MDVASRQWTREAEMRRGTVRVYRYRAIVALRLWSRRGVGSWLGIVGTSLVLGAHAPASAQGRKWLPAPREMAAYVDRDGGMFGNPHRVFQSPRGGFVLDDWSSASLREFTGDGDLAWRFGGRGSGPGEFARIMDVEFDRSGNLMVLDVDLARITVADAFGTLMETYPVPGAAQVLPRSFAPGQWAVMPTVGRVDTLWVSRGPGASRSLPKPTSLGYRGYRADLAAEGWATNLADGGAVIVFRWSSKIVVLDSSGQVSTVFDGIEPIPFPEVVVQKVDPPPGARWRNMRVTRVDPKAVTAVMTASFAVGRLFVHFAGATDNARRIVDTYSIPDGVYLGSFLLPHPVRSAVALRDGRLATLETELLPTVRLWNLDTSP